MYLFSGDVKTLDEEIPYELSDFLFCLMETLAVLVIISYSTPYFALVLIPLAVAYGFIQVCSLCSQFPVCY